MVAGFKSRIYYNYVRLQRKKIAEHQNTEVGSLRSCKVAMPSNQVSHYLIARFSLSWATHILTLLVWRGKRALIITSCANVF